MNLIRLVKQVVMFLLREEMVGFPYHLQANRLTLHDAISAVLYFYYLTKPRPDIQIGEIMAEERVQDYTDDKSEGHVDTREKTLSVKIKTRIWAVILESM